MMEELKKRLATLTDQAISLIDEFTPEELAMVRDVFSAAQRKLSGETVTKQDLIPQGADLLYVLAGGNPQAFANYLRQYPDANLNALAKNKGAFDKLLARLQGTVGITKGSQDGIPQQDLQSSTVYGFKYDPRNQDLYVKFQGDGVYKYNNVPPFIYRLFANGSATAKTNGSNKYGSWFVGKSPSSGSALNQLIKQGGFQYQKLS